MEKKVKKKTQDPLTFKFFLHLGVKDFEAILDLVNSIRDRGDNSLQLDVITCLKLAVNLSDLVSIWFFIAPQDRTFYTEQLNNCD